MSFIKVKCLASGSTANSYAVELPWGELIAIECGIHPKEFMKKCGKPDSYWISHPHTDHSRFEKEYWLLSRKKLFANNFELSHGTSEKPCFNRGFWVDYENERFIFATDFYNFERAIVEKAQHGIAMIECSHDFIKWKAYHESNDKLLRLKALQWENHACEVQTVALLDHFFARNFDGEIILLHRSAQALDTMGVSEAYIRERFKFADIKWAQNILI